ncbi:hypothetical protein FRC12_005012 [Ceratobasidium sp. 428]|nr:hypothetical protein FRC12_005012 [Ceratobasidium sp. 428]
MRNHLANVLPHTTQSIPWNKWGEDSTRWIWRLDNFSSGVNMHGSRFVMSLERTLEEQQWYHFVADFNPLVIKRHENRESEKGRLRAVDPDDHTCREGVWLQEFEHDLEERGMMVINVGEDTPTVMTGIGQELIVSRLPYRLIIFGEPFAAYTGWVIDGNRLVGIKRDFTTETEQFVVHYIPE